MALFTKEFDTELSVTAKDKKGETTNRQDIDLRPSIVEECQKLGDIEVDLIHWQRPPRSASDNQCPGSAGLSLPSNYEANKYLK